MITQGEAQRAPTSCAPKSRATGLCAAPEDAQPSPAILLTMRVAGWRASPGTETNITIAARQRLEYDKCLETTQTRTHWLWHIVYGIGLLQPLAALDRVTRHVMVGFSLKGQGRWQ